MLKSAVEDEAWEFWGTVHWQFSVAAKQVWEPFLKSTKMIDTSNITVFLVEACTEWEQCIWHVLYMWWTYHYEQMEVMKLLCDCTDINIHKIWHTNLCPYVKLFFFKLLEFIMLVLVLSSLFVMFLGLLRATQHRCIVFSS